MSCFARVRLLRTKVLRRGLRRRIRIRRSHCLHVLSLRGNLLPLRRFIPRFLIVLKQRMLDGCREGPPHCRCLPLLLQTLCCRGCAVSILRGSYTCGNFLMVVGRYPDLYIDPGWISLVWFDGQMFSLLMSGHLCEF